MMRQFDIACKNCACCLPNLDQFVFQTDDFWDDQDLMELFRISSSTIKRLKQQRKLPFIKLLGKTLYPKILLYQCLLFKLALAKRK